MGPSGAYKTNVSLCGTDPSVVPPANLLVIYFLIKSFGCRVIHKHSILLKRDYDSEIQMIFMGP